MEGEIHVRFSMTGSLSILMLSSIPMAAMAQAEKETEHIRLASEPALLESKHAAAPDEWGYWIIGS